MQPTPGYLITDFDDSYWEPVTPGLEDAEMEVEKKGYAWDSYDGIYRCPICDDTLWCAATCTERKARECERKVYGEKYVTEYLADLHENLLFPEPR